MLKSTLWTVRIIWASDKGEEKGVISVGSVDGNGGSPLAIDCDIHKSHVWDFFQINFYTRSFYQCIRRILTVHVVILHLQMIFIVAIFHF